MVNTLFKPQSSTPLLSPKAPRISTSSLLENHGRRLLLVPSPSFSSSQVSSTSSSLSKLFTDASIATILGNPGLLSYYIPFLTTLSLSPTFPPNCAILALAHIGHSPHLEVPQLIGLDGVVESELAVVDELLELVGTEGKLGLSAHSMGCWISVEVSFDLSEASTSLKSISSLTR